MQRAIAGKSIILAGCWLILSATASASELPRVFLVDPAILSTHREAYRSGRKDLEAIVKRLRKDADKALRTPAVAVTSKDQIPPSGDKHDYMSMGKYWWPDPSKAHGKPYIRKDGLVNPDAEKLQDNQNLNVLIRSVSVLALAYYFTGDEPYAEHAALLLRTWFLDPDTRMNSNLDYAQAVPGRNEGRGPGIIDAHRLPEVLDGIGLLNGSRSWRQEDQRGMQQWCGEYLRWLAESPNGKAEESARNNHGTWYDVQTVALALFLGDTATARDIVTGRSVRRIGTQIARDGQQLQELQRTKSWDYSFFNLAGMFELASLAERVGIDLWHYRTNDGRGIQAALDWTLPYVTGEKNWEHEQIVTRKTTGLYAMFLEAAEKYGDSRYSAAAERFQEVGAKTHRIHLFLHGSRK